MPRFVVWFMKDVLGDEGCEREVCQSAIDVEAADKDEAARVANQKFCETQHLRNWSLHADRIKVRAADFPS